MRGVLLAWAAGALVLSVPAFAADPLATELALARRLFSDARTAEDAKDWPTAVARLRDAISIVETPGLRFHLAYCEEQQKLLVEALVDYERAEDLPSGHNEEFRSQIPSRRASLLKRIPTIALLLGRDPAGANLVIDGHPLPSASFGKPIPLNPGKHVFEVSAPGFAPFKTELSLDEADALVTNVVMIPTQKVGSLATSAGARPAMARPADAHRITSPGVQPRTYVLIGEAAVLAGALAVAIVFTLEAAAEDETASRARASLPGADASQKNSACMMSPTAPDACARVGAAVNAAQTDRLIARVGFVGAGVGVAALAGTFLLWPSSHRQAAATPWIAVSASGLSLGGHF
jgi:hypothetical protein